MSLPSFFEVRELFLNTTGGIVFVILSSLTISCGTSPSEDGKPEHVARFSSGQITKSDLEERILEIRGALVSGQPVPGILCQLSLSPLDNQPEQGLKGQLPGHVGSIAAQDLALESVLLDMAVEENLTQNPSYLRQLIEFETTLLVDFLEEALQEECKVPMKEAEQFFQEHRHEYTTPERVLIRHIFVNTDFLDSPVTRSRDQAEQRIDKVRNRISEGEDFELLVHKYSDSESAKRGGLMGPIPKGKLHPKIDKAAFELHPGEVSPKIEIKSGFHLIQLLNRIPAASPEWEQVRDKIILRLENERYQERIQEVKEDVLKTSDVTNHLDRLALMNDPEDLLFRVGKDRFTVADYLYLFPQDRPITAGSAPDTEKFDKDKLRDVFERSLFAEAARLRGYTEMSELRFQLEKRSKELLMDIQFQKICAERLKEILNDEEQLRDFYEEHKDIYWTDLRVVTDRISLSVPEEDSDSLISRFLAKKQLRKQARQIVERLREGTPLSELAQYGVTQWRETEAPREIAFFERKIQPVLRQKAVSLVDTDLKDNTLVPDPGITDPIELDDKFVIFRVREVFPERLKTFEEVRQDVEASLLEIRQREIFRQEAEKLLSTSQYESLL